MVERGRRRVLQFNLFPGNSSLYILIVFLLSVGAVILADNVESSSSLQTVLYMWGIGAAVFILIAVQLLVLIESFVNSLLMERYYWTAFIIFTGSLAAWIYFFLYSDYNLWAKERK